MTSFCQPLPHSVVQDLLQIVARAICDRPGDTPAQRESRTRQMVYSVLGFEPRDGLEYMLATTIVGHFHMILDAMRGVFEGQMDSVKAQSRSGIVSLDRMMLGFIRELRLIRNRPLARWAEDAQRQAEAAPAAGPIETPEWVAPWAGVRPAPGTTPESPPVAPAVAQAAAPAAAQCAAPAVAQAVAPVVAEPAAPAMAVTAQTAARPAQPAPERAASHPAPTKHEPVIHRASPSPPDNADDIATKRHIAEFEEALAALANTLEEARALDGGKTGVAAASGD